MDGNKRFVNNRRQNPNQTTTRLVEVAQGQEPFAAILGCADSRVPAEIVFDQGLGDLFVCRIAGNVATAKEIASLEFSTAVLRTKLIMVLGHGSCGAVYAALRNEPVPGTIGSLLDVIRPGIQDIHLQTEDSLKKAIKANVRHQMQQLMSSSIISSLAQENRIKVVGGYYDLQTGVIDLI